MHRPVPCTQCSLAARRREAGEGRESRESIPGPLLPAPARPVGDRGWPRSLPPEGAGGPTAGSGGGPAGLMLPGGSRAGRAPVSARSARDLGGRRRALPSPKPPPAVPPNQPLRGRGERSGRSVPPRVPQNGASPPSPLPAAKPGAAVPARGAAERSFPRRAAAPGGAGPPGHPAPRQAPSPPNPGTPCLGEVINPTPPTAPTVMFVTACPSLGVERSMTGLCCLNKNQWQLKGENSSY